MKKVDPPLAHDHTQKLAVAPCTLDGQLGTEPEREDEARNSSRSQVIHDDFRSPLRSVDGWTMDAPDTENILLDVEKVSDMQPSLVQKRQPRMKKVDPPLAHATRKSSQWHQVRWMVSSARSRSRRTKRAILPEVKSFMTISGLH